MGTKPKTSQMRRAAESVSLRRWADAHREILECAAVHIRRHLASGRGVHGDRISHGDIAKDVRVNLTLGGRSDMRDLRGKIVNTNEWRLVAILSTAAKFGAFEDLGIESRPGVGWTWTQAAVDAARAA